MTLIFTDTKVKISTPCPISLTSSLIKYVIIFDIDETMVAARNALIYDKNKLLINKHLLKIRTGLMELLHLLSLRIDCQIIFWTHGIQIHGITCYELIQEKYSEIYLKPLNISHVFYNDAEIRVGEKIPVLCDDIFFKNIKLIFFEDSIESLPISMFGNNPNVYLCILSRYMYPYIEDMLGDKYKPLFLCEKLLNHIFLNDIKPDEKSDVKEMDRIKETNKIDIIKKRYNGGTYYYINDLMDFKETVDIHAPIIYNDDDDIFPNIWADFDAP